ncbi:MAG: FAD-dependent oxidoreductase [Firmicutes bacterium]|nr:FAD-dependent oxidoreductase [Bacillota bacterium]
MKLFQPIRIGGLEVKNRIVMPAMHMGYCKGGEVSERLINFYRERALGGAGLLMVGGCSIDPYPAYWGMVEIGHDRLVPGHKRLTDSIHEAGARIGCQLFHAGRYASSIFSKRQPIAPSPIPSKFSKEVPREMTLEDIEEVISQFASSAIRAREGGYDLVEVIASAGYLISQFFSPVTNRREDRYGGSFENRSRFGVEVIEAVRAAVGPGFPVMVRLTGNEFMPGGNTNREIQGFARRLQEAGADAFDVTGGWHESRVPQITMGVPNGAYVYLAQGIKRAVDVPVAACNRINDPRLAEEILVQGRADLVGMARVLMADPELPRKASEGRFREIRKCIGCNQGCLDMVFKGRPVTCLVNSRVGREGDTGITPAETRKRVLVIGGGAAGMEAARVAAARGHDVTLWEKSSRLGGQLLLAGLVPDRGELLHLVEYLVESLNITGVKVELNRAAGVEEVEAFAPDAVVVAAGALPVTPAIPGIELGHVVEAWEVLSGQVELGRRVVIVGGGAVGCELGMFIARMGAIDSETVRFLLLNEAESVETIRELATRGVKEVVILEMDRSAGRGLGISTRWIVLQDLARMGVTVRTSSRVQAIIPGGVLVDLENGENELIEADSVVIAVGSGSENQLYQELKDRLTEVYLVGDASRPRTALEAVREGFDAGYSI